MPRIRDPNEHIEFSSDGTAIVTKTSMLSGAVNSLKIKMTKSQYDIWLHGHALIQVALPNLTPEEREFLMTGCTPEEWNKEFKIED